MILRSLIYLSAALVLGGCQSRTSNRSGSSDQIIGASKVKVNQIKSDTNGGSTSSAPGTAKVAGVFSLAELSRASTVGDGGQQIPIGKVKRSSASAARLSNIQTTNAVAPLTVSDDADTWGLSAVARSTSSIGLTWTNTGTGLRSVLLDYSTSETPSSRDCQFGYDLGNVTSVALNQLQPGVRYYFRVCALRNDGTISSGSTDYASTEELDEVSGLSSSAVNDSEIDLSWNSPSTTNFARYSVNWQTGSAPTSCSSGQIFDRTTRSVRVSGLTANTWYYFRVCVVDQRGNVSNGVTTSERTDSIPAPANPTNLLITALSTNSMSLSWSRGSADTGSYLVSVSADGPSGRCSNGIDVGMSTAYTATGLQQGTLYYITVCAVSNRGGPNSLGAGEMARTAISGEAISSLYVQYLGRRSGATVDEQAYWASRGLGIGQLSVELFRSAEGIAYSYRTVLGRRTAPSQSEIAHWSQRFAAITDFSANGIDRARAQMAGGPEGVGQMYRSLLGRFNYQAPSTVEINHWVRQLQVVGYEAARMQMLASPEGVTNLYRRLLGRLAPPNQLELDSWMPVVRSLTRVEDVYRRFVTTDEGISSMYRKILWRVQAPNAGELESWRNLYTSQSNLEDVYTQMAASREGILAMYRYDLGRLAPPSESEIAFWANRMLKIGYTRVKEEVIGSSEGVQNLYATVLGRKTLASDAELNVWQSRISIVGQEEAIGEMARSDEGLNAMYTRLAGRASSQVSAAERNHWRALLSASDPYATIERVFSSSDESINYIVQSIKGRQPSANERLLLRSLYQQGARFEAMRNFVAASF